MNNKNLRAGAPDLPAAPDAADIREVRRRFGFTLGVAALACITYGLTLSAVGLGWPLGISDLGWGALFLVIRHWSLAAPGTQRLEAGVHMLGFFGQILLFQHIWHTGLTDSFAVWYLCLIPIAVALLGSMRVVVTWTGASLVTVGLTHLVEAVAPVPPLFVVDGYLLVFSHGMLVLIATAYTVAALRVNDRHLASLHDAYDRLLVQKELLDQQASRLNASLREAEDARAAADAANRAKSDFLAMMSHEIRTPLNGVIGLNNLLLELPLEATARRYAELGRQSGETLLALVNDFLDFSRMEAGHVEIEQVPFAPAEALADAVALVQPAADARGLSLVQVVEAPALVIGDPGRLKQVLMNLLGNAIKFTPRGEVRLACAPIAGPDARTWLRIEVHDTGIGIEPEAQQRLFQPFAQADASTTRRYGGTGLGLAISRSLVLRMGGRIGVHSAAGEGSAFWVELPFGAAPEGASVPAAEGRADAADGATRRRFRGRVLVVEDNAVNQLVARKMLERFGLAVDVVGDGHHAIHAVGDQDYDLVLMDCEMPGLDGYDATRAIRQLKGPHARVPIAAMTAGVLAGNEQRCRAAGMDDFLPKPVKLADLEQLLARFLPSAES